MFNNQLNYLSLILFIYYWWACDNIFVVRGVSRHKLRACSDFQDTIQQQGPIEGGGEGVACPPQNVEKKHQIVLFRCIFTVKRRYDILA